MMVGVGVWGAGDEVCAMGRGVCGDEVCAMGRGVCGDEVCAMGRGCVEMRCVGVGGVCNGKGCVEMRCVQWEEGVWR